MRKITIDRVNDVANATTQKFTDLVAISGLNPRIDFRDSDLRYSRFQDDDISNFDFSGSDLTGSRFVRTKIPDNTFKIARLIDFKNNNIENEISKDSIFRELVQRAVMSKTYTERGANTIGYAAYRPTIITQQILAFHAKFERSTYVRSIIERCGNVIASDENENTKSLIIFKENANSSYPLDRRRLHSALERVTFSAPRLSSYWQRRTG